MLFEVEVDCGQAREGVSGGKGKGIWKVWVGMYLLACRLLIMCRISCGNEKELVHGASQLLP